MSTSSRAKAKSAITHPQKHIELKVRQLVLPLKGELQGNTQRLHNHNNMVPHSCQDLTPHQQTLLRLAHRAGEQAGSLQSVVDYTSPRLSSGQHHLASSSTLAIRTLQLVTVKDPAREQIARYTSTFSVPCTGATQKMR
jgi:hypothetical protein